MEECVKDNLHDAIGGLKDYRSALGKANDTMNDALGAISRLERENKSLRAEPERLRALHREEPQCLDADGVPIKVGDTVYFVEAGYPVTVSKVESLSICYDEHGDWMSPRLYSHRKPDSWEQLADDAASYDPTDYVAEVLGRDTSLTMYGEDAKLMKEDVLRRAKRLAGVDDE